MTEQDTDWAAGFAGPLRVKPGSTVQLPDDFDPGDRFGLHKKKDGARLLQRGAGLLTEYQRRLAAQDTWVSWSSCRRSTRAARTARSGT
jgi:hypothetical protein